MKNISFLSENFQFLEVKFSLYLNRHVSVMTVRICPKTRFRTVRRNIPRPNARVDCREWAVR